MKRLVFWLLIFLVPTQLGYHFWPDFSYVSGFKIDYLSPTIYLTDLVLIVYLILSWKKPTLNPLFFILIFINTYLSAQPILSMFFWSKLVLYYLFFLSLTKTKNINKLIRTPLLVSTLLVVAIQLTQLILQKSVGGPLYFLGERTFNFYTSNLAKINLPYFGLIIRPYSIFSHPNSLAGFLLIVLIIQKWPKHVKAIISAAIILTFSKMAIFTLFLLQLKNQKISILGQGIKIIKIVICTSLLVGFLPLLVIFTNTKYIPGNSLLERVHMGYPAFETIKQNLLAGTGLRGYVPTLPQHISPSRVNLSSLQPVHSLPLLVLSELGLLGFAVVAVIIKKTKINKAKHYSFPLAQIILIVALTGAVDHYWWTLPQNQLILVIALALVLKNKNHDSKN
jgi:hypothetical protein